MDIISTSKQKKQQAALQSSCCLGVTFRLKWVSPQYEDISKTQWNMSDLHERHIKYLRSSNIHQRKSVTYWQADVLQAQENTSVTALRHGRYLLSSHSDDGWCQEHRKQQNCLFFVFFHADISRKSHRGSSAPHISKHIWSCKVTWSKQHLALSVRISQFISSDKFTITESLFKIINIYRLKNKDDKKNKKVKKKK